MDIRSACDGVPSFSSGSILQTRASSVAFCRITIARPLPRNRAASTGANVSARTPLPRNRGFPDSMNR